MKKLVMLLILGVSFVTFSVYAEDAGKALKKLSRQVAQSGVQEVELNPGTQVKLEVNKPTTVYCKDASPLKRCQIRQHPSGGLNVYIEDQIIEWSQNVDTAIARMQKLREANLCR